MNVSLWLEEKSSQLIGSYKALRWWGDYSADASFLQPSDPWAPWQKLALCSAIIANYWRLCRRCQKATRESIESLWHRSCGKKSQDLRGKDSISFLSSDASLMLCWPACSASSKINRPAVSETHIELDDDVWMQVDGRRIGHHILCKARRDENHISCSIWG